jgi:hypothetical protein
MLAAKTAAKLTCKDKATISAKPLSKFMIRDRAAEKASLKLDIFYNTPIHYKF